MQRTIQPAERAWPAPVAHAAAAFGSAGIVLLAIDDVLRFTVASPLLGPIPTIIGAASAVLLLTAIVAAVALGSTRDQTVPWVSATMIVQLFGRVAAADDLPPWFWLVTAGHVLAPVLAIVAGFLVARVSQGGERRLGCAALVAATCWLLASWVAVPLQLVPVTRTLTDLCLLFVVVWPLLRRVRRGVQQLWDSAAVR